MPLYEYLCDKCGSKFELIEKFSDEPKTVHEGCGGSVNRLISAPAFHLKGSGWYATDYAKTKSPSDGDSKKSSDGKSSDSKDSKDSKESKDTKDSKDSKSSSDSSSSSSSTTPSTSSSSSSSDSSSSGGSKS